MDITSTRLNALIGEALTPQPVPLPKADPATAALIKTLVQPPAPSTGQAAQIAAQSLQSAQPRPSAQASQRLSSSEVEDAYRAVMEPDAASDDRPARPSTGRAATDTDQVPRGASPQVAFVDNASRPVVAPAPSTFSPAVASAAMLVAANANAPQPRGAAVRPAGHAPRSDSAAVSLWTISVVTAVVSAMTATIMVLLLR
ncbi:hypothetical protein RFM41_29420 [Mesorhizobium sp. VK25A]|uniref:Uncharacterized protein n=1 Tax=Mesorhizobium vachelliae TaxID=3072309 RepID=A0ABU5ADE4_9HYPH|nr:MULTISPECIES: hypothetical protein [unclassified Mesorhizobium]MDX8535121.1 hypothetical protein [Mesorhizobium sp. VK25D]MDX8547897.1 hypothetical protein [Mesorhizobium sp. VK25A]